MKKVLKVLLVADWIKIPKKERVKKFGTEPFS